MPTFGSLFAGIGGIDLGLERAGWECRFQVEWDEFCQRVLAKHWPDVPRFGDITTVDWNGVEQVDLLAGGFPCQPVSIAGRRAAQDDDRWLWPEFERAIRVLRPELVLVENVSNLLVVNDGRAFGQVVGGLAALGYDAEWDCVPAAAVGAPHVRDRVWIIGARPELRRLLADPDNGYIDADHALRTGRYAARNGGQAMADATGERLEAPRFTAPRDQVQLRSRTDGARDVAYPVRWQFAQRRADRRVGRFMELDSATPDGGEAWPPEPAVGRVVDGFPGRMDQLRALGNAVVPQVVEVIGRQLIAAIERAAYR